ncbi:ase-activated receptor 3-like [Solea senegalensis]|uniref:Ase-activated receptor 3-like n=1 Tax=Solea senegalensis TaxID=28829 RepID=A0AAV6R8W1_SOLSE|nr:2-oxoglutarate receptor 1-like [Solea senegalensis]KAG7500910.1 ase-activated receptor 3-like [Solea senegalensis]
MNHTECGPYQVILLSMVDSLTFVIGQPVVLKLMWSSLTSPKTPDILNTNLAVFHNIQYLISLMHLFTLFLMPQKHGWVFSFLFVYVQIGGPMSLSFICMQRYVAVVHPLSYPLLRKYRYSEVCAAAVWFVTLPITFIYVFTQENVNPSQENFYYAIPSTVMVLMIMLILKSSITVVKTLRKHSPGDKTYSSKKKAFSAMQAMLSIGMFFYLPVLLMQKITAINEYMYICITTPAGVMLLSLASVVHPIFVLSTQGKLFQKKRQVK